MTILKPPNPYPGLRPLDKGDYLVGRQEEVARIAKWVHEVPVVELHGRSGVGKSSLIRAGVVAVLDESKLVVHVRDWSTLDTGAEDPLGAYVAGLEVGLNELGVRRPRGQPAEEFLENVRRAYEGRIVVVFDQLEELLRNAPVLGRWLLRGVADVVRRHRHDIAHVLSLRSEYKADLEVVEKNVYGQDFAFAEVEDVLVGIDDEAAREHIEEMATRPLQYSEQHDGWRVDGLDEVFGLWRDDELRTIHVQALLWTAYEMSDSKTVDVSRILDAAERSENANTTTESSPWLDEVLHAYIKTCLDNAARSFAEDTNVGKYPAEEPVSSSVGRIRETLATAARIAPYLSSGGFKVPRPVDDLAFEALDPQLAELRLRGPADNWLRALTVAARAQTEADAEDESDLARTDRIDRIDRGGEWLRKQVQSRFGLQEPVVDDGVDMVSAWLKGSDATTAAAELVACLERALRWMGDAGLVRRTRLTRLVAGTDARAETVALVHDSTGEPLKRWARDILANPRIRMLSPVGLSGKQVLDERDEEGNPVQLDLRAPDDWWTHGGDEDETAPISTEGPIVYRGLRWHGCIVSAAFSEVKFVDCDFRGTLFEGCKFTDVEFENCTLWGTLFLDCAFDGASFAAADKGTSLAANDEERGRLEVRSLSFTSCTVRDDTTLTLKGLRGVGLFVNGLRGNGNMELDGVDLEHVRITRRDDEQPSVGIVGKSVVRHLSGVPVVGEHLRVEDGATVSCDPTQEPRP